MKKIGLFFKRLSILLTAIIIPVISMAFAAAFFLPSAYSITPKERLCINCSLPVSVTENKKENEKQYNAQLKLMGVIPIKSVSVKVVKTEYVTLCGTPFGVKIFTDGVMVVGLGDIYTADGIKNPARRAGLKIGDIITEVNGKTVYTNTEVASVIERSGGNTVTLKVTRSGDEKAVNIRPVLSSDDNIYKAGMWIRDSSAGIGTLTFCTGDIFAGLGHGICDIDTGEIIPLSDGETVPVTLTEVTKSKAGFPGELKGFLTDTPLGTLCANSESGVYGKLCANISGKSYAVAHKQEICEGSAYILTTVPGKNAQLYSCNIEKINYNQNNLTRNIVIKITDSRLLEATGGIVQGMSGSPIVQNGKFIGAVTHVFVNNPSMGYGIFAENMLACAKKYAGLQTEKAS